jgi:spore germination protein YaaH
MGGVMVRRVCVAAVVAALLAATAAASPAAARLAVTGFQVAGDPTWLIDRSAASLATVGVDGDALAPNGGGVLDPGAPALAELAQAHADRLRAELLISNFSDPIGDFSEPLAHRLLASRVNIGRVTGRLGRTVSREGWNGICVDLESLTPRDSQGLIRFLVALRRALPRAASLSIAISNETSAGDFAANGYQLEAIGRVVSRAILMAYDEHGPWENTPGPVGELSWQRAGLSVILGFIPAARIDLGVAGYGYGWLPHSTIMLSDVQARSLVQADRTTAHWDGAAGEWTARLRDGSVLWWSDARSYALRVALARAYGLHGLAVWSLGLSDPLAVS